MRLREKTKLADEVMDAVQTRNITEDNKYNQCRALAITQLLGVKGIKNKKKEKQVWKRRTDSNNNPFFIDLSLIER